jgi:hypothetical protein
MDDLYCVATNSVLDLGIPDMLLVEPDSWYPNIGVITEPNNIRPLMPTLYSKKNATKKAWECEQKQRIKIIKEGGHPSARYFIKSVKELKNQ